MYVGTVLTNEAIQTKGMTFVHLIRSQGKPAPLCRIKSWELIHNILPMKLKRMMVLQAYETPDKQDLLAFLRSSSVRVAQLSARVPVMEIYGDSVTETVQKLAAQGIGSHQIPHHYGGTMD